MWWSDVIFIADKLLDCNSQYQNDVDKEVVQTIVGLFTAKNVQLYWKKLTIFVYKAVRCNADGQKKFIDAGITRHLTVMVNDPSLVVYTIQALHTLAEYNQVTQRALLASAAPDSLLNIMKKTLHIAMQVNFYTGQLHELGQFRLNKWIGSLQSPSSQDTQYWLID